MGILVELNNWICDQQRSKENLGVDLESITQKKDGQKTKVEVANTKATMRQLRRTQTAVERYHAINELESWKQEYLKAVKQTRDWNLKFLKPIAHKERQKTSRLLDCPTMLRVFKAFNRDLTHMGWNVLDWRVIEHVVRRELKA
ncbi:hypothetical protein C8R44DRAFT_746843 [Mycena epipterygia]|nr:hypothetical protein C8R44DRAFT_746843 [Mycena epipterygia]